MQAVMKSYFSQIEWKRGASLISTLALTEEMQGLTLSAEEMSPPVDISDLKALAGNS